MSTDPNPKENRRPHTVYLTDDVWDAIERRHLEAKLSGEADSKIEFLEGLITTGLGGNTPTAQRRPSTAAARVTEPATPSAPAQPKEEPAAAREAKRTTPPPAAPKPRRSSALDRLMQASDPGRPAPIASAAEPTAEVA